MKILTCILNLVFPIKCGICGKIGEDICDKCYNELQKMEVKNQYEDLFFVYKYEGIIRNLIIKYKFDGNSYLYRTFSKSLLKNKNVCKFLECYDIIIPVPLHKKRKLQRGYNQSELVAMELAKGLNELQSQDKNMINKLQLKQNKEEISNSQTKQSLARNKKLVCLNNVLIKNKNIKPQSEKGIKQRLNDVKGIYEVRNKELIKGKKIILFDDIYTTGSTVNECKKVLQEAGAKKVGILTLAKDYII